MWLLLTRQERFICNKKVSQSVKILSIMLSNSWNNSLSPATANTSTFTRCTLTVSSSFLWLLTTVVSQYWSDFNHCIPHKSFLPSKKKKGKKISLVKSVASPSVKQQLKQNKSLTVFILLLFTSSARFLPLFIFGLLNLSVSVFYTMLATEPDQKLLWL